MCNEKLPKFNFEDLDVWQRAIEFADQVIDLLENLATPKNHFRLVEQLEAASTSVAMNIAEGKGRFSKKEFIHFLYIARGSLFETVTLIKIFERRDWINGQQAAQVYRFASDLTKKINALIGAVKKST